MISGVAVAAVSATGAFAQATQAPAPAAAEPATQVQELVVTGSRIPQRNLTSVSPITTINNQQVKLQGTTNVEDLINNLPQAFATFGQFESNGGTGTATVNLRGLGDVRTLVLVDGKRVPPGDPIAEVADLNFIPPALIDRVEVLTGGASAVYGSDAVAGVVNFIMKHNYEGLQIDSEFSIGEHDNNNKQVRRDNNFGHGPTFGFPLFPIPSGVAWLGPRRTVTITGGANTPDDKGNVEFYLGYTSIGAVKLSQVDWGSCTIASNNTNTLQQYCAGSSNDATGRITINNLNTPANPALAPTSGLYVGGVAVTPTYHSGNGYDVLIPGGGATMLPFAANQAYNYGPANYIQRPDTRWNAGEFSHYQVAPWLDLYSSFMFMDDHTAAQIAPSGAFLPTLDQIPCNDPLLSAQQATTLCTQTVSPGVTINHAGDPNAIANVGVGRRNVEGGAPRIADLEHEDFRIVFGAKGDIGQGWTYDFSGQWGQTNLTTVQNGYFLNSRIHNALDVIPNPAAGAPGHVGGTAAGAPVCLVASLGIDAACVPWNIFSPGGVTQQALNYLASSAVDKSLLTQQVVTATIAGDLGQYGMKSPWATDGIGISVGVEYHREFLQTQFDAPQLAGDLAGSGGASGDTRGSQSDKDVFGEIRIPLIQNMTFFKDLTFEGGYRYADYTHGGGNSTYKLGGDWQIIPDLRLRVSYERAVRAPNVSELFAPVVPGLVAGTDPCAGAAPKFTAAECLLTGVPTANYGEVPKCVSGQCGGVFSGNPGLSPETGKTFSAGFVFTPTFFRGFSFSLDYFNIDVSNAITVIPLRVALNGCAQQGITADCALIVRDASTGFGLTGSAVPGTLGSYVLQRPQNAESLSTRGIDINADYRTSLADWHMGDMGSLDFNFTGTYVNKLVTSFPGATYDCAGLFGVTCGTPTPKWRHQFRITWVTPWNLTFSANWRFIGGTALDFNTSQASLQDPNGFKDINPTDAHIPSFSYFDLSFQYKFRNRYTVRGGVNNIFDRTPPLLDSTSFGISAPAFGNGNTYPQVYDPLGRVFFVGLTADF
jgi:outer membrane receptor protein involved in Fe transport